MALPQYVARDYSGGVVEAVQLTAELGSSDLSFNIATTTGWVNANGDPLGTVGPFTCVLDLGAPSVEKILCSSVNLSSGLVTVYSSGGDTGRGYDQTTAQAHVPGASVGLQPCWSAVEAAEANAAVVLGPGGGGALIGLTGNPAGRVHAVSGTITAGVPTATYTTVASDFLQGSMTTSTHGLTIPVTGWYQVNASAIFTNGGTPSLPSCFLYRNSSTPLTSGDQNRVAAGDIFTLSVSDVIPLTATNTIALYCETDAGTATLGHANNTAWNYLSASLVSH